MDASINRPCIRPCDTSTGYWYDGRDGNTKGLKDIDGGQKAWLRGIRCRQPNLFAHWVLLSGQGWVVRAG